MLEKKYTKLNTQVH